MTRQHFSGSPTQFKHEIRCNGGIAYTSANPIGTEILRLLIAFVSLCRQSGFYHPHRLYGFFDVMDANDLRALHRGNYRARKAAVQTV